jgi:hypothetical protein
MHFAFWLFFLESGGGKGDAFQLRRFFEQSNPKISAAFAPPAVNDFFTAKETKVR